ncbi:MAG: SRPBCC family protein [Chthoniobacterales bacterium]
MSTTAEEKLALKLQRTFAAPRERVFAAWTDPEQVKHWFGPDGCTVSSIRSDLRVGGEYRFAVVSEQYGAMAVRGEFREIAPPSRLVYTWQWEDDPDYANRETLITVEFIEHGGSTEIRLTHENFPSAENAKNHEYGWTGALEKLAALLNT